MKKPNFIHFYLFGILLSPNYFFSNFSFAQDTISPVAYCLSGFATVPLPSSGCITIEAKDLNRGSIDNSTASKNLKFYFDGDHTQLTKTFCCEDFAKAGADDELLVDVQMWVEDEAGNTDYCKTTIIVQDNQNICPSDPGGNNPFYITGTISTPQGTHIIGEFNVKVTLNGPNGFHSETNGSPYKFENLTNGIYNLCVEKNDDVWNGVSTADIVKIKRHILGLELMTSPYKLLASDLNRSKYLTAADVSELKKIILGINSTFTKVPSWIFVPADFIFLPNVFPDVNQFIPSCKTIEIKDKSIDNVDFIGIKMGNVN